jgi:hypothetical protein
MGIFEKSIKKTNHGTDFAKSSTKEHFIQKKKLGIIFHRQEQAQGVNRNEGK